MQVPTFHIYHSSAGSGKTFTLVKSYLKIALSQHGKKGFRKLLAITFTNKAVNEMKERILRSLSDFSLDEIPSRSTALFSCLCEELVLSEQEIKRRSRFLLKDILHNYAFFDVSTIDKFNHRLIRTFSKDLGLAHNFEVTLDADALLEEAVDKLISKTGTDPVLTELLLDFAIEQAEEDRNWDISRDLQNFGRFLFNENHNVFLSDLMTLPLEEFQRLRKHLRQEVFKLKKEIVSISDQVLEYLGNHDLDDSVFSRKTLPNHFRKFYAVPWDLQKLYGNQLESNLQTGAVFNSKMTLPKEKHLDFLLECYLEQKQRMVRYALISNAYGNFVPLTLLASINQEIEEIEQKRSLLPIGKFNQLISEQVRDQPTPFIYERMGEIYRHYFIDEFQDTSQLQWENLIPLVQGALSGLDDSGQTGSLFLVGDVKQAIYRWRGGRAEQFLNLINLTQNPFDAEVTRSALLKNYRSSEEIIAFNNDFFKLTSPLLQQQEFRSLFEEEVVQEVNDRKGGLVSLRFLEKTDPDLEKAYTDGVFNILEECSQKGFGLKEICVLVRRKKEATIIAKALTMQGIPVISPESLLLASSPKVQFLIQLLYFTLFPTDLATGFEILNYLAPEGDEKHEFIKAHLNAVRQLLISNYSFDPETLEGLSVYEGCTYAINKFQLADQGSAYITFLLDEVLSVERSKDAGIDTFLEHWESKKDSLGIPSPEGLHALTIMTVHKAKGLEFPIVIYPFANSRIYHDVKPKIWVPTADEVFEPLLYVMLNKNASLSLFPDEIRVAYEEEQCRLELDSFNVLYVALTRAINGLYVLANKELTKDGHASQKTYNGLLINYLMQKGRWNDTQLQYDVGTLMPYEKESLQVPEKEINFTYSQHEHGPRNTVVNSDMIWETKQQIAIEHGRWAHQLLSEIHTSADIDPAISKRINSGELTNKTSKRIRDLLVRVVDHKDLAAYYSGKFQTKNEQDILTKNGVIFRPDRIAIKENEATIIDYKTGKTNPEHEKQLYVYQAVLEEMGYQIPHKILVYLGEEIKVKFI
ncbi:MAG: UvrD-helicase domain-containing protein [Eudoraea sp.]|nr:UvrD-helicase domain-containing protein [Eudoraea sp.]